ncbi:MAG: PAS domain S-box protein [Acidobacteria bacterium]|nr:PAS domain S-box protein [Acidobacteriota bacterium]
MRPDQDLKSARILIARDANTDLRPLDRILRSAGYRNLGEQPPDLLIVAGGAPVPPHDREVPVLICGAGGADAGASDFLSLPPDPPELLARVGNLLELRFLRRDLARRGQAASALQALAEPYRSLFENAPLPEWVLDEETLAFLAVNQAAIQHYGYSREEFLRLTLLDIQHPDSSGKPASLGPLRHRAKDGTTFDVEIASLAVTFDRRPARLSVVRDITDRLRTGRELAKTSARLEEAAQALEMTQAIVRRPDGAILFWARRAARLYGWSAEEALGKISHQLLRPEFPQSLEEIDRDLLSLGHWQGEVKQVRRDGSVIWVSSHWSLRPGEPLLVLEVNNDITARKRAEERIAQEKKFAELVVNTAFDGILTCDLEGRVTLWNPAMEQISGFSREQCLGKNIFDLFPFLKETGQEECVQEVLGGRTVTVQDIPFRVPETGKEGFCEGLYSPLREESGNVAGFLCCVRDVTGLKRAGDELREQRQRLELALHASRIGLIDMDLRTGQVYFSPEYQVRLGIETHQGSEAEWRSRVHPEDRDRQESAGRAYIANPAGVYENEYRLRFADGVYHWILARGVALRDADGKPYRLLASHMDLTGRKQAEEALRESQERLALVVQASQVGLWDWDLRSGQFYFSPEYQKQLGYPEQELPRNFEEWQSLLHPEDRPRVAAALMAYFGGARPDHETEYRVRQPDGSYRWILARSTKLPDAKGDPCRVLGAFLDITESKRAEECLRDLTGRLHAVSEEERTVVARALQHELGQALIGMKMHLSGLAGTQSTLELIDTMIQAVRRISIGLRPEILDLGLVAALDWQAREFRSRTGIACHLDLPAEEVALDPDRSAALFRIFQESLTNVTRHSGATRVDAALTCKADEEILLEVRDNGKGVSEETLRRTRSLGVAGMRERALLFGGDFTIQGAPGQGTLIRVRIPAG